MHTGELLENWKPEQGNPEEVGTYVQGDMLIEGAQPLGRNGLSSTSSRWPNGIVPYVINGAFSAQELQYIEDAIAE